MKRIIAVLIVSVLMGVPSAWALLDEAVIYLPFEGEDRGAGSEAWRNHGAVGEGASSRVRGDAPNPTVSPYGIKGQSYDGRRLTTMERAGTHMWDESAFRDKLDHIQSFTFTAWVWMDEPNIQGRIFSSGAIEINKIVSEDGRHAYLAVRAGDGQSYVNSINRREYWDPIGEWRFIAVTYDGTRGRENLVFYYGGEEIPVAFASAHDVDARVLSAGTRGGRFWLGNTVDFNGPRPFVGQLDEVRLWVSNNDDQGMLTLSELEAVRQHDLADPDSRRPRPGHLTAAGLPPTAVDPDSGDILDRPNIYLPFEGLDRGLGSMPWKNRGVEGYRDDASRRGRAPNPRTTRDGLRGQAYDSSMLDPMEVGGTYMWGPPSNNEEIGRSLEDTWSFTFTAWIRVDEPLDQGRLFSAGIFEVNYIDRPDDYHSQIAVRVGPEPRFVSSTSAVDLWGARDDWRFIAVTYDGSKESDQLAYYSGGRDEPVQLVDTHNLPLGRLDATDYDRRFWVGNTVNFNGPRPFVGLMDEVRVWASQDREASAALSTEQLETIRQRDLDEPEFEYDDEELVEETAAPVETLTEDAVQPVLNRAIIYLPFEGEDKGIASPPWMNFGAEGRGAQPGRAGQRPLPRIAADGVKGQAYDARHFQGMERAGVYKWGPPSDNREIGRSLQDVWSFTFSGWIRTEEAVEQGRLFSTGTIEINYINNEARNQNYIGIRLGEDAPYMNSGNSRAMWGSIDQWRFVVITYDGTLDRDQLRFYSGTESDFVQLDRTITVPGGRLEGTLRGRRFWLGNNVDVNGPRPFVGLMDEVRVWSSTERNADGALTPAEIEAVRRWDVEGEIATMEMPVPTDLSAPLTVDHAAVYLPFEGADRGPGSEAWANQGRVGKGVSADARGDAPNPRVRTGGIKGQAYDAGGLQPMQAGGTYRWGGQPNNPLATGLAELDSFSITGWMRASRPTMQGRILSAEHFSLAHIQDPDGRLATLGIRVGDGATVYAQNNPAHWDIVNQWRFFAVTYGGNARAGNLRVYTGGVNESVRLDMVHDLPAGTLRAARTGGTFWLGNAVDVDGSRPFAGMLDEIRIWTSKGNEHRAVLTEEEVEAVRRFDVGR